MSEFTPQKLEIKRKVAIVIPCYKASDSIDLVVNSCLSYLKELDELIIYKIIVINDACPDESCKNIKESAFIKLLHNKKNLGVGASTIKGIKYALEKKFDIFIKLDADGQHPPKYLVDLIPFIERLPKFQLFLTKGTRYKIRISKNKVPFSRKIGTLFLDPIARSALNYRGLSDVTNGFLGMDSNTAKLLIYSKRSDIEPRYLFESSLLAKCSELEIGLNEFYMIPYYGVNWNSSMNALSMVFPLFYFWLKTTFRRIFRKYLISFNLGTLLLLITIFSSSISSILFFDKILPEIKNDIFVTAGTSSAFTSSGVLAIISLALFFFYDYASAIKVKTVFFEAINND